MSSGKSLSIDLKSGVFNIFQTKDPQTDGEIKIFSHFEKTYLYNLF